MLGTRTMPDDLNRIEHACVCGGCSSTADPVHAGGLASILAREPHPRGSRRNACRCPATMVRDELVAAQTTAEGVRMVPEPEAKPESADVAFPWTVVPALAAGEKRTGYLSWPDTVLHGWEWPYIAIRGN